MMIQKSTLQTAARMISISLVLFLFNGACSKDEKPLPSSQTHKIVKSISRPPVITEAKTPKISESLRPEPEQERVAETKPAAIEEGELEKSRIRTEVALPKEEKGYYVVKRGDTLADIAAREDVYGDSLKWPILWRHNVDGLNDMSTAEDLPDSVLPEGMRLRVLTEDEVKNNLEERGKRGWAVNLLSSPNEEEVIPVVVRLVRAGFPVYITRANVKGTDYTRVRVGFFAEKAEADAEGRRLVAVLNLPDFWTIKAIEKEVREFGGY
jgi:hypothetical protein